jgi:hypothetical protein
VLEQQKNFGAYRFVVNRDCTQREKWNVG